jgi:aspartate racemase
MKTIGLIGGMSWESTAHYYRHLNEIVRDRLGGSHSARLLLWSVDFAEVVRVQFAEAWDEADAMMADAARRLAAGGAEAIVLATNTMHKCAAAIEAATPLPLLHIADATGERVRAAGCRRPLLLATRFTMEEDFYRVRLAERFGLDPLIPDAAGRTLVHDVIYDELCQGIIKDASREAYRRVIAQAAEAGADGVILGCTEIGMLIGPDDTELPVFDTTRIHTEAAMDFALAAG